MREGFSQLFCGVDPSFADPVQTLFEKSWCVTYRHGLNTLTTTQMDLSRSLLLSLYLALSLALSRLLSLSNDLSPHFFLSVFPRLPSLHSPSHSLSLSQCLDI